VHLGTNMDGKSFDSSCSESQYSQPIPPDYRSSTHMGCVPRLLRTLRTATRVLLDRQKYEPTGQVILLLHSLCDFQPPTAHEMHGNRSRTAGISEWDFQCDVWLPSLDAAN
jgi:hypothetical protein